MSSSISTGEDKYRALASTSVVDSVDDSLLDQIIWTFHGHTIVRRSPAAAVDRYVLEAIIQRSCFIGVCYRTGKNADSGHFGLVGNADATDSILLSSDLTRTARPMVVIEILWRWEVFMVVKIV